MRRDRPTNRLCQDPQESQRIGNNSTTREVEKMSAYIVDRDHIAYLVAVAASYNRGHGGPFSWWCEAIESRRQFEGRGGDVGQILWDECIKSVSARYPNDETATLPGPRDDPYTFTGSDVPTQHGPINPVDVFGAIRCYTYQSCAHDDWEKSEAHGFCEALKDATIRRLPGSDSAAWGAPDGWRG